MARAGFAKDDEQIVFKQFCAINSRAAIRAYRVSVAGEQVTAGGDSFSRRSLHLTGNIHSYHATFVRG